MRSDVDLCIDQELILTAAEADRLRAQLPAGWTDDRLETLERHDTLEEPFDAYELFDICVRDAVDADGGRRRATRLRADPDRT